MQVKIELGKMGDREHCYSASGACEHVWYSGQWTCRLFNKLLGKDHSTGYPLRASVCILNQVGNGGSPADRV